MTSNTKIHGNGNQVAGRDIHIHYGQNPQTKSHNPTADNKQLLTLEIQALESALKAERKSIFKSWPFIFMVTSTLTFFPLCFFFVFEIFDHISEISKWSSIDKANKHREAIHPLWIAPAVIIEIVIMTWFQKSSESSFNTISILKEELAKVQAQLQKIKFQVK